MRTLPFEETKLLCRSVVQKLFDNNRWQLLSVDAVTETVLMQMPADADGEGMRRLAINTYCKQALHPACLGVQGTRARQQGFTELAAYLYPIAYNTWPQIAEDATQEALAVIFEKIDQCRKPGAFLAFAIQKLRDSARRLLRRSQREQSLDELLEQDSYGDVVEGEGDGSVETIEDKTIYGELRGQVVERLRRLRAQNPRAQRQLDAVWLRYIHERSNEEIASLLETTPANVSVLLHRGLARLQEDPDLYALAREILERGGALKS